MVIALQPEFRIRPRVGRGIIVSPDPLFRQVKIDTFTVSLPAFYIPDLDLVVRIIAGVLQVFGHEQDIAAVLTVFQSIDRVLGCIAVGPDFVPGLSDGIHQHDDPSVFLHAETGPVRQSEAVGFPASYGPRICARNRMPRVARIAAAFHVVVRSLRIVVGRPVDL